MSQPRDINLINMLRSSNMDLQMISWKAAKPYLKDSMKKNQISVFSLSSWGMAHGDDYWMWQCSSFGGHYSGYGCYADPRENYLRLSSLREAKASLLR